MRQSYFPLMASLPFREAEAYENNRLSENNFRREIASNSNYFLKLSL